MGTRKNLARTQGINTNLRVNLDFATTNLNKELQLTNGVQTQLSRTTEENRIGLANLLQANLKKIFPTMTAQEGAVGFFNPVILVTLALGAFFIFRR